MQYRLKPYGQRYFVPFRSRADSCRLRSRVNLVPISVRVAPCPRLHLHYFRLYTGSVEGPAEAGVADANGVGQFGDVHRRLFANVHGAGRIGDVARTGSSRENETVVSDRRARHYCFWHSSAGYRQDQLSLQGQAIPQHREAARASR